jgi:hypothetical protein
MFWQAEFSAVSYPIKRVRTGTPGLASHGGSP